MQDPSADLSYTLGGTKLGDNELGTITIDPRKPTQIALTHLSHGPNGDAWIKVAGVFGFGYYQTNEGGLRIIVKTGRTNLEDQRRIVGTYFLFNSHLKRGLYSLGLDNNMQTNGRDWSLLVDLDQLNSSDNDMIALGKLLMPKDPVKGYSDLDDSVITHNNQ